MKNKIIEFEKGFHPNDIPSFVICVNNNMSGMTFIDVLIGIKH